MNLNGVVAMAQGLVRHVRALYLPKSHASSRYAAELVETWFHMDLLIKIDRNGVLARDRALARHVRTMYLFKSHASSQYAAERVDKLDFIGTSSSKMIEMAS